MAANGYASRFATDWSFVWCKYSEIKSGDKILDAELDRRRRDLTSRASGQERFLLQACAFVPRKERVPVARLRRASPPRRRRQRRVRPPRRDTSREWQLRPRLLRENTKRARRLAAPSRDLQAGARCGLCPAW